MVNTVTVNIDELRKLIIEYHRTRGCGCCSDYDARSEAENKLGKFLGFDEYKDGSGYNLYDLPGESHD